MNRSAEISADGRYRYRLDRWWGDGPRVAWIMLNPSTADAEVDDPTIRRCIAFTKAWGYDGLTVLNLWPFRATSPDDLKAWLRTNPQTMAHLDNLNIHRAVVPSAPLVVAAWGADGDFEPPGEGIRAATGRGTATLGYWSRRGITVHHLGLTKGGHPRHPLYLKGDTKPIRWATSSSEQEPA